MLLKDLFLLNLKIYTYDGEDDVIMNSWVVVSKETN